MVPPNHIGSPKPSRIQHVLEVHYLEFPPSKVGGMPTIETMVKTLNTSFLSYADQPNQGIRTNCTLLANCSS